MNRASSATGWVKNPDGSLGWTWNPITGCLNGCEYCYARKLANGRLRERYLANHCLATGVVQPSELEAHYKKLADPFYPRFWEDRLETMLKKTYGKIWAENTHGIFVCDMSDLFGIGIPERWTKKVLDAIKRRPRHRFYLLTKQPQNLIKFSPFPENCWVGVTATDEDQWDKAIYWLGYHIQAKIKFISVEPFLKPIRTSPVLLYNFGDSKNMIHQVIIGSQTKPYKPPKIEWVEEIVTACDKAGVAVFLKDNLKPLFSSGEPTYWAIDNSGFLRQKLPNITETSPSTGI